MPATIKIATFLYITKLVGFPATNAMENYFLISEEEDIKIPWRGTVRESILAWAREEMEVL